MRNVRESARWAARDLKAKTAILDARYLCGDESVFTEFDAAMREHVWSANQAGFIKEKLAESVERHRHAGDSIYLLNYLFIGGPSPRAPFPDCGLDPTTDDSLDCVSAVCQ